jgi:peptidyl-prolyl cis-trans isomerase B (cyclophilin B)
MLRKALTALALGVFAGFLAAGTAHAEETAQGKDAKAKDAKTEAAAKPAKAAAKAATKGASDEVAVMQTSKGTMVIEFWEKDAPQTVANFKKLAKQGFYDGTGFHRIIKNFMIQGGDPLSKNPNDPNLGTGSPGYTIPDEFNSHKHVPGVLSMAHSAAPNSGGSQFFIMHGTASSLDGKYTAFGHLIRGMDVLNKIADTPCGPNPMMPGENSKPKEWTKIISVKIEPRAVALGGGEAKKGAEKAEKAADKAKESVKASAPAGSGVDMKKAMEETKSATPATPATPAKEDSAAAGDAPGK